MIKLFAKYDDDMFITTCFESCDILNMLCGKSVQFDIIIFFIVISFVKKNIEISVEDGSCFTQNSRKVDVSTRLRRLWAV